MINAILILLQPNCSKETIMSKQKQCKSCKEWIDAKATKCPHCQTPQTSGCLKFFLISVVGFILILCIIGSLVTSPTPTSVSSKSSAPHASSSSTDQATQGVKQSSNWQYKEDKDEFDEKLKQYCGIHASNTIKGAIFGVTPILTIRKYNKKAPDIFIKADGVVFGHPEDSDRVRLKFDDEKPFSVSFSGAADSSSDLIFLNSESKIISKLKTAKTLVIELPVFMEGNQRATFDVTGYKETCQFK